MIELAAGSVAAHIIALTEGVVKTMFLAKLKNAVALATGAVILTAGAGVWHYAAVAGQNEKRPQEAPAPAAPKADAVPAPKIFPNPMPSAVPGKAAPQAPNAPPMPMSPARASRAIQIALKIVETTNGQRKLLAEPRFITLEGRPASITLCSCGDTRTIDLGGGKTEEVMMGVKVSLVVRPGRKGKMRLDATVSKPGKVVPGDTVILETKSVRWITDAALGEQSRLQFAISGKPLSVLEVTAIVQEAKLVKHPRKEPAKSKEKPPVRVGQLFIIGNEKTSDKAILKQVPFFPGQILNYSDLQIAEQNLSRLKGLKSNPKVTVLDRDGDGEYKDIEITVEEK